MHAPISEPPQTVGDLGQTTFTQGAACQDRRHARRGRAQLCVARHHPLSMSPKLPQLMSPRQTFTEACFSASHHLFFALALPRIAQSWSPSGAPAALGKHFRHRWVPSSSHHFRQYLPLAAGIHPHCVLHWSVETLMSPLSMCAMLSPPQLTTYFMAIFLQF